MKKPFSVLAAAAVTALLLSGCVPSDPEPEVPTETPTVEPTDIPTTGPTTPTGPPALGDLVIRPAGLGDLLIEGNAEALSISTGIIEYSPDFCAEYADPSVEEVGRWIPAYPETSVGFWGDQGIPFAMDIVGGKILRIDVFGVELADEHGIRIGSTRADFLSAFPEAIIGFQGSVTDVYVLDSGNGSVVYEITRHDDGFDYWDEDDRDIVFQIRVLADGTDAFFATAASGNIAGACPF